MSSTKTTKTTKIVEKVGNKTVTTTKVVTKEPKKSVPKQKKPVKAQTIVQNQLVISNPRISMIDKMKKENEKYFKPQPIIIKT